MMTLGITFCVIGFLHGGLKYPVIRRVARDIYNGGGVPLGDFFVVVPLWLTYGTSLVLIHTGLYPFALFGVVLYFVLAAVLYGVMEFEFRRGKPEVERQLAEIEMMKRAGYKHAPTIDTASPGPTKSPPPEQCN